LTYRNVSGGSPPKADNWTMDSLKAAEAAIRRISLRIGLGQDQRQRGCSRPLNIPVGRRAACRTPRLTSRQGRRERKASNITRKLIVSCAGRSGVGRRSTTMMVDLPATGRADFMNPPERLGSCQARTHRRLPNNVGPTASRRDKRPLRFLRALFLDHWEFSKRKEGVGGVGGERLRACSRSLAAIIDEKLVSPAAAMICRHTRKVHALKVGRKAEPPKGRSIITPNPYRHQTCRSGLRPRTESQANLRADDADQMAYATRRARPSAADRARCQIPQLNAHVADGGARALCE